ncbi:AT-hook motif nuclear-localized protein 1 [Manihot esculenta]|uniref:AT-hook motif nuclear-localized protein 1 n=1 Tax=Manihot esculenta TaxID=3983 RepID=UPI001CC75A8E|nr:AT-hook motif nuclear-localized protein 1 [Manihot esculenta]
MTSADSQLSPVAMKNDPQVSQVEHQEAKEPDLGGGGGAAAAAAVAVSGGSSVTVGAGKRKRGRPKKFVMDSGTTSLPVPCPPPPPPPPPPDFTSSLSKTCEKRGRGRPLGSGKLQLLASLGDLAAETAGGNFIPLVARVDPGEISFLNYDQDIISLISSFAEMGPRAVCVLSASGVVSKVVIHPPGSDGGVLQYEGLFEILTLSGSFAFDETSGERRKTGVLTVSLAKPNGQVFGGGVVGSLIAYGPIQLILGSFKQNVFNELKLKQLAEKSAVAAGSPLGDSETERSPFPNAGTTEAEGHCTTPTSALLETANDTEAGNTTTDDPENVVKPVEPISDPGNEDC